MLATLSETPGGTVYLRLSERPVPVAAAEGELERILIDAALQATATSGTDRGLMITTSTVVNPIVPGSPLPKGRYGRVIISDMASSLAIDSRTGSWAIGVLEGRLTITTDAEGRTTITILLPLMAEL